MTVEIKGLDNLDKTLKDMVKKAGSPEVEVGYSANYALYVHEMEPLEPQWGRPRSSGKGNYWDPQGRGQNKFLEKSLRKVKPLVSKLVRSNLMRGATFKQALYMVGLLVQAESQKIVPVDTANLKQSAYTRITKRG